MGSECESEKTPILKLSLYSLPNKAKEPSWMTTPPIHTSVSIPFQWEEAPGKPRPCVTTNQSKPHSTRCLELPPRLLTESKVSNNPSPTNVLEGPDTAGRFVSQTLSFRNPESRRVNKEKVVFGSSRWGSFRKPGRVVKGSFDFSSPTVADGGTGGGAQMKITRDRRKGSLLSLSQARSHVLASIYESFKQVVKWRRGQEVKMKNKGY
ncbi:uncharacterized protein LOC120120389 [Hibiscus syriacus]|uniref:uncharacterized protein LOC120120389 n=1 Tax=Hibiscus syriacus TaxID=106335 RepID=UPI001920BC44|nr:uncharacterized protein LOC120120389 [Hibiscus syriacus]